MPRPSDAVHQQPCRARGCAENARSCGKTPTVRIEVGGYRTHLCFTHAQIESAKAKEAGGHSKATCRNHGDGTHLPGVQPEACNFVKAAREGRPVWGWEVA